MKLIFAIVNNDDSSAVSAALTKEGYFVTKLASTGGFLRAGNTTFLIGTEDSQVDEVIAIISDYSKQRTQMMPANAAFDAGFDSSGLYPSYPIEVTVGGATVFVTDIERFEKL